MLGEGQVTIACIHKQNYCIYFIHHLNFPYIVFSIHYLQRKESSVPTHMFRENDMEIPTAISFYLTILFLTRRKFHYSGRLSFI